MKRISLHILIALFLLLQSCIKEDLSTCKSELFLRFRYTLNGQHSNLFGSEVHRVIIYIFDSNGKYVESFSEQGSKLSNDYVMRIPLPEGTYSAVVYGGEFATYSIGELNSTTNTINTTLRKGVTDINDLRMELKNTSGAENYLYPDNTPDDIFVGSATGAIAARGNQHVTDIDLIKNTKKIKIKIHGIDPIAPPLDIYITDQNGRYDFQNSIDSNLGIFKYTPISAFVQSSYMEADLKTMRLVLGQFPTLVIKYNATPYVLYDENMIEQILQNPKYVSQEDFDREDEFVFEITIRSTDITVSINGWVINNINPDI